MHSPFKDKGECNSPINNQHIIIPGECNSPLREPSDIIGAIVQGYKSSVPKQLNLLKIGCAVWQPDYYKHIIRNDPRIEHCSGRGNKIFSHTGFHQAQGATVIYNEIALKLLI